MIQHILVATDGSSQSNQAALAAANLASALKARLTGVTVTEEYPASALAEYSPRDTPPLEVFNEQQSRAARARLAGVTAAAQGLSLQHEVESRSGFHVYRTIIDVAREKGCDLIVVASHGHLSIGSLVLGSETTKILTHCAIPVLVYRGPATGEAKFKHILVPTDGSRLSQAAIAEAVSLAKALGARVTGLCVEPEVPISAYGEGIPLPSHPVEEFRQRQAQWSKRCLAAVEESACAADVEYRTEAMVSDRPDEAIIAAAREGRCDLIFMASHGRRGVAALLLGSVTNKVLTHCDIPVLVHRAAG
jgi:nucleotide-binding universal stress UspA family protein